MDAETLGALQRSIAKWERNTEAPRPENYLIGADECALCTLFYWKGACNGCPVMERTGFRMCSGSPYSAAARAWDRWIDGIGTAKEAHDAARAEVEFLKSLLPAGAAERNTK